MAEHSTVALSIVDAILRRGAPNTTNLPAGTLCDSCADVSLKVTIGEAKANNRRSRHEQARPAMFADEIEVSFPSDSADPHLDAFMTAFINAQPIPVFVTDKAGMHSFSAVMGVFGLDDTQTLNEVAVNKFTLKPYACGYGGPQPSFA